MLIYFFSFQLGICIPIRMDRKCKNNPGRFCYINWNVVLSNSQTKISDFRKKHIAITLKSNYEIRISHLLISFAVKRVEDLRDGKRKSIPFAILMVWREEKDHITDNYFCMKNLKGINRQNKHLYNNPTSLLPPDLSFIAQTFLFLSRMVTWNIALIPNIVT